MIEDVVSLTERNRFSRQAPYFLNAISVLPQRPLEDFTAHLKLHPTSAFSSGSRSLPPPSKNEILRRHVITVVHPQRSLNFFECLSYCLHGYAKPAEFYVDYAMERFLGDKKSGDQPLSKAKKVAVAKLLPQMTSLFHHQLILAVISSIENSDEERVTRCQSKKFDSTLPPVVVVLRTLDNGESFWVCSPLDPNAEPLSPLPLINGGATDEDFRIKTARDAAGDDIVVTATPQVRGLLDSLKPPGTEGGGDESESGMALQYSPTAIVAPLRNKERHDDDGEVAAEVIIGPFTKLKYPTVDITETKFIDILHAGMHPAFKRNAWHFIGTLLFALALSACGFALLHLLRTRSNACCTPNINGTVRMDCSWTPELTIDDPADELVCLNTCRELAKEAPYARLFSSVASSAPLALVIASFSFVCILCSIGVSFFHVRALAQKPQHQRFWIVLWVFQILCGAVVLAIAIVMVAKDSVGQQLFGCDNFYNDGKGLCMTNNARCMLGILSFFDHDEEIKALIIAIVVLAGIHFLISITPPMPSEEQLALIQPAKPDTAIFRPATYCPDGPSEEFLEDINENIRQKWRREKLEKLQAERLAQRQAMLTPRGGTHYTDYKSLERRSTAYNWHRSSFVSRSPLHYGVTSPTHNRPTTITALAQAAIDRIYAKYVHDHPQVAPNSSPAPPFIDSAKAPHRYGPKNLDEVVELTQLPHSIVHVQPDPEAFFLRSEAKERQMDAIADRILHNVGRQPPVFGGLTLE